MTIEHQQYVCALLAFFAVMFVVESQTRAQSEATFTGIGDLEGGTFASQGEGISGDGNIIVGVGEGLRGREAIRWSMLDGMLGLEDPLPDFTVTRATAASHDGAVVVGVATGPKGIDAFRWTQASGMVLLEPLGNIIQFSGANDVSADGSIIVGVGFDDFGRGPLAVMWLPSGEVVALGTLDPTDLISVARAVSADGTTVVGGSRTPDGLRAFRWTAESGMVNLGALVDDADISVANAVSADGSVVVGYSDDETGRRKSFRWTAADGMVALDRVAVGCNDNTTRDVSGDGRVIVGECTSTGDDDAFIWDPKNGMRKLSQELRERYGLDLGGWRFATANGISTDGTVITGTGFNFSRIEAWRITIPPLSPPCPGDVFPPPNGDDVVGVKDLLYVIRQWGNPHDQGGVPPGRGGRPFAVEDLLEVIRNWGPCPE